MTRKLILSIVFASIGLLSILPNVVAAQDKIILSPAFTDLGAIDSNQTHKLRVTLYNQTSQAQVFALRTVVLVLDAETNQLAFAPNNAPDISYLGTLDVPESIELAPGTSYEVASDFRLSPLIAPGSHQFALLFQPQITQANNTNLIVGEFAAIVNFTSGGSINYRADMNLTPLPNPSIVESPELAVDVSNQGNAIIQPQGVINIRAVAGIPQKFSQEFNTQAQLLFQGQTRNFDVQLEFGSRAVLGLYEVEAVVAYGPQHKVISRKTSLLVLPWYFLLGIVGILITGGIVYYKRRINYVRNKKIHNPSI